MATFSNKFYQKNPSNFACDFCDFVCSCKRDLDRHFNTKKHQSNINSTFSNEFYQKKPESKIFTCELCNKNYIDRTGLWRHKKKCIELYSHDNKQKLIENLTTDKDLIMMLIKDNNELRKMMMEQQTLMLENNNKVLEICKNGTHNTTNTHTNSHNKAFNLNFFLNETCKNAMNIMDFAESIQLQLSHLEAVGEAGYVEGISNIIVKNLKALDITERPIHCADKKREVIYIKDQDKWEKDEDKSKIKKLINRVSHKNIRLITDYREKYPECKKLESKISGKYNKMKIEAMESFGENNK